MLRTLAHPERRILVLLLAALLAACGTTAPATPAPAATPTIPAASMPEQDSWILVDLPADATQLQQGAEIYRLVCSACHAHSGEGLTDAWRATWHPDDQNCWQSKCHAANHPPDGFELPVAPAVVGREALAPFQTAADLHAYIQATMPWQEPNSLTEDEGWAVTAYVIKLNRMNPGDELNAENGDEYRLHPESAQAEPTESSAPVSSAGVNNPASIFAGIVLLAFVVLLVWRAVRRVQSTKSP